MSAITLDLQDGFFEDLVVITAEGRELARVEGVSTRFQIGLARSLRLDVPSHPTELLIAVPTKDASVTVTVDPRAASHVGVSRSTEGELEVKVAPEPFGYL
jgi:hypothetical protein